MKAAIAATMAVTALGGCAAYPENVNVRVQQERPPAHFHYWETVTAQRQADFARRERRDMAEDMRRQQQSDAYLMQQIMTSNLAQQLAISAAQRPTVIFAPSPGAR